MTVSTRQVPEHTRILLNRLERCGLPPPVLEWRFAADQGRRWRFDAAWPDRKVALEVQGAVFSGGRHSRGAGMRRDYEKHNAAVVAGWTVLYVLPEQITRSTEAIDLLARVLGGKDDD